MSPGGQRSVKPPTPVPVAPVDSTAPTAATDASAQEVENVRKARARAKSLMMKSPSSPTFVAQSMGGTHQAAAPASRRNNNNNNNNDLQQLSFLAESVAATGGGLAGLEKSLPNLDSSGGGAGGVGGGQRPPSSMAAASGNTTANSTAAKSVASIGPSASAPQTPRLAPYTRSPLSQTNISIGIATPTGLMASAGGSKQLGALSHDSVNSSGSAGQRAAQQQQQQFNSVIAGGNSGNNHRLRLPVIESSRSMFAGPGSRSATDTTRSTAASSLISPSPAVPDVPPLPATLMPAVVAAPVQIIQPPQQQPPPFNSLASTSSRSVVRKRSLAVTKSIASAAGSGKQSASAATTGGHLSGVAMVAANADELLSRTEPLQGNIQLQFVIHYVCFTMLLYSASATWASTIHAFWLAVFCVTAFIAVQLSRLALAWRPHSTLPFYLTHLPFAWMLYSARDAHVMLSALWYISLFTILLQSANSRLTWHMIFIAVGSALVYSMHIGIMSRVFVCDGGLFAADLCMLYGASVGPYWPEELLLMGALILPLVGSAMLARFIKANAALMVEHEHRLATLYTTNVDLKRQIRRFQRSNHVDLVSPILRVIATLKDIQSRPSLVTSDGMMEMIHQAIAILASNELFTPQLDNQVVDRDMHNWLQNVLQTHSASKSHKSSRSTKTTITTVASSASAGVSENKEGDVADEPAAAALTALLDTVDGLTFNVFDVEQLAPGKTLLYSTMAILKRHEVMTKLPVDVPKLKMWLRKIDALYLPTNLYHNSLHAADVTYMMHHFLIRYPVFNGKFGAEEVLAAIMAAATHDLRHPGFNNAFLIATRHPIAIRYNDNAVLENFHAACAFDALLSDGGNANFMHQFPPDMYRMVRDMVITLILCTDMAVHFEWIGRFRNKVISNSLEWDKLADRKMVLAMAIKAADVGNAAKANSTSVYWSDLILEEFFRQGDEERRRGMPVSAFMNRELADIPKSQMGFIDFIVLPLYEPWVNFLGDAAGPLMDNIQNNRQSWRKKSEQRSDLPGTLISASSRHRIHASHGSVTQQEERPPGRRVSIQLDHGHVN